MSIYRNIVWFLKGRSEYTKAGFDSAACSFDPHDLPVNLKGKVAIVTGANSGLGKEITKQLSAMGATVHMLCRDAQRAEEARSDILNQVPQASLQVHSDFDASLPAQIVAFVREFSKNHTQLDILVNNAGTMEHERKTTPDGLDFNFATNTLGTFVLTESLLPLLRFTAGSRVIVMSSGGMLTQHLNDDYNFTHTMAKKYDGTMAYAQTKRQLVELTNEWAKRCPDVRFYSCHPGWTDTPGVAKSLPSFYTNFNDKLRTVEQGADTAVWAAASKAAYDSIPSGSFLQDRKAVSQHLPLAWTHSTPEESAKLYNDLSKFMTDFCKCDF